MILSAQQLPSLSNKTVVFTGAMQPARMRKTDAPFNLGFAIGALQCLDSGVYIAMNGNYLMPTMFRKIATRAVSKHFKKSES